MKPSRLLSLGGLLVVLLSLQPAFAMFKTTRSDQSTDREIIRIPLDDTGIADWRFLSGRQPAELLSKHFANADIRFINDTVDRVFVVEVQVPGTVTCAPINSTGFGEPQCKAGASTCLLRATLSAGEEALLAASVFDPQRCGPPPPVPATTAPRPNETLEQTVDRIVADRLKFEDAKKRLAAVQPKSKLYVFTVRFFDDVEPPANKSGYLYVPKNDSKSLQLPGNNVEDEPPTKMKWMFAGSVGYRQDPDPNRFAMGDVIPTGKKIGDAKPFSVADPFVGKERTRLPGAARVDLTGNLGSRANVTASFAFKSGDLGEKDQSGTVKTSQYAVSIFGRNHLRLRFGKTTFLAPTSGLAIFLKGDGFEISRKELSVGYLVQRESDAGVANRADQDQEVGFVSYKLYDLLRPDTPQDRELPDVRLVKADLYGVWGQEEGRSATLKGRFSHWTVGADLGFRFKNAGVATCAAGPNDCKAWTKKAGLGLYYSEREPRSGAVATRARGTVGLLDFSFSQIKLMPSKAKAKQQRNVRLLYGLGTGDDAATLNVDEGFIGHTAVFAPDKLFLKSLVGTVDPTMDVMGTPVLLGQLGRSLTNKQYMSVVYTDNTWSLLQHVASWLGLKDDIESKKTILSYGNYRFERAFSGSRKAGEEVQIEFLVETPKGVNVTLGGAQFDPGDSLRSILGKKPFAVFASVSVTVK